MSEKLIIGIVVACMGLVACGGKRLHDRVTAINAAHIPPSDTIALVSKIYNVFESLDSIGEMPATDENIKNLLKSIDIQHPHIVYAQMCLESGNFASDLAKSNNNYFGMKHPNKRPTFSIGRKNGYANYRSWVYSVLDYAMWQRYYMNELTEREYLRRLKNYATDEEYVNKIKRISKNYIENT